MTAPARVVVSALLITATAAGCVSTNPQAPRPRAAGADRCAATVFPDSRLTFEAQTIKRALVTCGSTSRESCLTALRLQACALGADVVYDVDVSAEDGEGMIMTAILARRGGPEVAAARVTPPSSTSASGQGAVSHSHLPVFSKVLFYVRENYFDKARIRPKVMLLGALDFLQRDIPEVVVIRAPGDAPESVLVRVNGKEQTFAIQKVDAPWSLRSALQAIFSFVLANLEPLSPDERTSRQQEVELVLTNGMLQTLDPHSVLLPAPVYASMRGASGGKPGATGLVLSVDQKSHLVVRGAQPGSPAERAGLQANDRIVQIDELATANLRLEDAVTRLRGDLSSTVDLLVERDGAGPPRRVSVTRAEVAETAVRQARVLTGPAAAGNSLPRLGYLHLENFSHSAGNEVTAALSGFQKAGVTGIVLDLRNNSGGLYAQAVEVADAFLSEGKTVSMVGVNRVQRKDEVAQNSGREPNLPVVVLVNRVTAAAGEIVAAALRDHDRGVVIGEPTAGAATVQVLFDVPFGPGLGAPEREKHGLKLTTAEWLPPSDRSVANVGIRPDIELVPRRALGRSGVRTEPHRRPSAERSLESVAYLELTGGDPAAARRQPYEDIPLPPLDDDFAVSLARALLAQAKSPRRAQNLAGWKGLLAETRAAEEKKLATALGKLGFDWSPGTMAAGATAQLTLSQAGGDKNPIAAGGTATLRATVTNTGASALHQVRAVLSANTEIFNGREMVFGKIDPRATKTFDLKVDVPEPTVATADLVEARLVAASPLNAAPATTLVNIEGRPTPKFTCTVGPAGEPDRPVRKATAGRPSRKLSVTVKNVGTEPWRAPRAELRAAQEDADLFIAAGRFQRDSLAPGASVTWSFIFERPEGGTPTRAVELLVGDAAAMPRLTRRIPLEENEKTVGATTLAPPVLTLSAPRVVSAPAARLEGVATSERGLKDVVVLVLPSGQTLPRKVVHLPAPREAAPLPVNVEVPLAVGVNEILVEARSTDGLSTTTRLRINRTSK